MILQLADPINYVLNGYAIPVLVAGIAIACLGFFVLFRERGSGVGASFLFLCLSVGLFLVSFGFNYSSTDASVSLFWIRISHLGVVFIPSSALLLTLVLFDLYHRYSLFIAASIGLSFLFCLGIFLSDQFIRTTERFSWGNYPHYGLLGFAFLIFFFGIMAYILFLYWRQYQGSTNERNRKRNKGLFFAFSGGYLGAVDFLPALGVPVYPFGYIPIFFFIVVCTYVVIRYQLVDITPETAAGEILETMQGAVIVTDLEDRIQVANRVALEMLGYQKSEILGRDLTSILPIPAEMSAVQAGERSLDREMVWPGRYGKQSDVIVSASQVTDHRNVPVGTVYVAHDITERKQSEDALRNQESELNKSQRLAHIGSWDWDAVKNTIWWSDEYYRIYGLDPQNPTPNYEEHLKAYTPESAGRLDAVVKRAMETGEPYEVDLELAHPTPTTRWIVARGEAKRDTNGNIYGLRGTAQNITERRQMENELRISEEKFRKAFLTSPDSINFNRLQDGMYVSVNDGFTRMSGYTAAEVIGKTSLELNIWADPNDRQKLLEGLRKLGEVKNLEARFRTKDGRVIDGIMSAAIIEINNIQHIVNITRDITELKQAERALRISEERLSLALQAAEQGIYDLDLRTGEAIVTPEYALMLGYDPSEFHETNAKWIERLHPDDRESVAAVYRAYVKGELPEYKVEFRQKTKDGNWKWILSLGKIMERDTDGNPLRMIGTHTDITERKQAEAVLQENQARLDLALRSAHMGVWRFELKENRRYFDDLTCQLFGIDPATFTGTPEEFFRVVHPEDREKIKAAITRAIEQDTLYEPGSYRVVWPDGSVHFMSARGRLIHDDKGQPLRVNGIVWDITDQHLLELERLKTQKLESIGTLAGGIAHDFNNLLQGVFGYISMAKLTYDQKEKSLVMLEQAEKALHQSVNLTSQLLTFAKGGKPVIKPTNVRPLIENAAKFALSGSRSDYRVVAEDALWQVEADEGQITQVIQNIVLNADQAMPEGGLVTIMVKNVKVIGKTPSLDLPKGRYVAIVIKDNGIGILEEHCAKIFDPYFTTKEKGSGLGLATSYSIIRNHGGLINVNSKVGKGSTFYIYLPASDTQEHGEPLQPAAVMAPRRAARVLVMDDEEVIRNQSIEILVELGHTAEVVEKGQEALEKYQNAMTAGTPFDIVILDLTVRGGMGGLETIQKLLQIDPMVKAIVSSGYSDDAALSNYRELGFQAFLKKPYRVGDLQRILNSLLA